jgi:hypothetical protein
MGDLPRKNDSLIMMGDLPKWKRGRVVSFLWVTYPEKNDSLIVMGDLPKWKRGRVVSFLWVTYSGGKMASL